MSTTSEEEKKNTHNEETFRFSFFCNLIRRGFSHCGKNYTYSTVNRGVGGLSVAAFCRFVPFFFESEALLPERSNWLCVACARMIGKARDTRQTARFTGRAVGFFGVFFYLFCENMRIPAGSFGSFVF